MSLEEKPRNGSGKGLIAAVGAAAVIGAISALDQLSEEKPKPSRPDMTLVKGHEAFKSKEVLGAQIGFLGALKKNNEKIEAIRLGKIGIEQLLHQWLDKLDELFIETSEFDKSDTLSIKLSKSDKENSEKRIIGWYYRFKAKNEEYYKDPKEFKDLFDKVINQQISVLRRQLPRKKDTSPMNDAK